MGKLQSTRKNQIQESQGVSPFPADDHNAVMNRQESMTNINRQESMTKTKRIHERSTALERSVK